MKFDHSDPIINEMLKHPENYMQDDFAKRNYSPLSNILKELRKGISINGNEVREVDKSNSQPFCLFVYLKNKDYFDRKFNIKITLPEPTLELKKELNELSIAALNAQFYQYIGTKFDLAKLDEIDRASDLQRERKGRSLKKRKSYFNEIDRAKQFSNYMLFGNFKSDSGKIVFKMVKEKFPQFAELLRSIKESKSIKESSYKNMAYILQRVELELVHEVCKNVSFPVTTIHDSFICEANKVNELLDVIRSVYEKYNFVPVLKMKPNFNSVEDSYLKDSNVEHIKVFLDDKYRFKIYQLD